MKNDDNENWWLVEDGKGQVGYVPVAYLATQPGKKDTERGLMEPRVEVRWDRMEKEERRIQRQ